MTDQIKLDFTFDDKLNCDVAMHNGYRIRAVRDESPVNPFEDHDGNLPMLYEYGRERDMRGDYECPDGVPGFAISRPFDGLNDELVIHLQHNFAKVLGTTVHAMLSAIWTSDDDVPRHAEIDDADDLREALREELSCVENLSDRLDKLAELHDLLGATTLRHESRGYCQGDWASLLLVAKPEQIKHLGITDPAGALKAQAELYDAWAWGDCYGYVIEKPLEVDEDGDVLEWEEIASCWGYFGSDHDESGLAEAALEELAALVREQLRLHRDQQVTQAKLVRWCVSAIRKAQVPQPFAQLAERKKIQSDRDLALLYLEWLATKLEDQGSNPPEPK